MTQFRPPPPEFTPVPIRTRRDGWTPERQFSYLVALAELGHGRRAAEAVGMTEQSAARLRRRPGAGAFNRLCEVAWDLAKQRRSRERLERLSGSGRGTFSTPREAETSETCEPSRRGS
jgi:hypothetical protein